MNIQSTTTHLANQTNSALSHASLCTSTSHSLDSKSSQTDTLTISADGLTLFEENQSVNKEALVAAMDATTKDDHATLKTVLSSVSEDEDEDEETTTTNLTSYTDSQIQGLVAEGTITQAEANAELAKRQQTPSDVKNTTNKQNQTQNTLVHVDVRI